MDAKELIEYNARRKRKEQKIEALIGLIAVGALLIAWGYRLFVSLLR